MEPAFRPTRVKQPRPLSRIFVWVFGIFAALGAVNNSINGAAVGVAVLIDGAINGLIWGGIVIGVMVIVRKVRSSKAVVK